MAPKKRPSSQPSTPSKKHKQNQSQSSLTSFFVSPSKKATAQAKTEQLGDHGAGSGPDKEPSSNHASDLTQEEQDARFAAELAAAEDGVSPAEILRRMKADEDLARRLDLEWTQAKNEPESSRSGEIGAGSTLRNDGDSPRKRRLVLEEHEDLDMYSSPRKVPKDTTTAIATPVSDLAHPKPDPPAKPEPGKPIDLAALDAAIQAIPLGDDIFDFDPYAIDVSRWPRMAYGAGSQPLPTTPYALLTHAFVQISATRSRLIITTLLTNLLRVIRAHDPDSLLPSVYLISNHIAPAYDGVELGIGMSIVTKAIKEVTGKSARTLKSLWDKTGDPGDVAYEAKKDVKALVKPSPITVQKLFSTLHAMARLSGSGSATQKLGYVTKLLVASRGEETRFLGRTFISHLRIQAVRTTIATALARVFALVEASGPRLEPATKREQERAALLLVHPEERQGILANATKPKERSDPRRLAVMDKLARAEKLVREVRARHPNFGVIVPALLTVGLPGLSDHVPLRIGTPISPMLGSITRSLDAMHDKLGPRAFVSEFKYDGQRCQIHAVYVPRSAGPEARKSIVESHNSAAASSGKCGKWVGRDGEVYVRLFSRHLEEMTEKYPDISDMIPILMGRESEDEGNWAAPLGSKTGSAGVNAAEQENGKISEVADIDDGKPDGAEAASADVDDRPNDKVTSFIMDAEVVAMGLDGELLPFQTLANRSRKDVSLHDIKVKVGVFAFDLMYLDGESLLKTSFRTRRNLLHSRFKPLAPRSPLIARFAHVRSCESTDPDDVARFFAAAQQHKCEGIMVKSLDHHWETPASTTAAESGEEGGNGMPRGGRETPGDVDGTGPDPGEGKRLEKLGDVIEDDLAVDQDGVDDGEEGGTTTTATSATTSSSVDLGASAIGKGVNGRGKALLSTYEPDKRCESWLKVKKDYVDGLGDSLDLVPIGAWHGMGRKATWWSPILLAVYDADTGVFQAVCKCISGFTDAFYKDLNVRYAEGSDTCVRARHGEPPPGGYEYDTGSLVPDVWWRPSEVWELRGADITLSPNYTAALGLVSEERGLSIRFPRFIKRRDDKGVEQASSPHQLAAIYRDQQRAGPKAAVDDNVEDEDGDREEAAVATKVAAPVDIDFEY
ncbi:uncharacterized protein PFL1_04598 [Pseudozyma flocculosa PF-1]|uniref:Related to DNA ligase I n=2 Tax=Pseudozyma flocculosa TaxID=84751 RepID=A0A5C3FBI0_9BASI|nr:uncharacterized protein PFL1_04598 [Pseudozyma flocculosa PF-1]EPQ27854.1 hypothetical protein PFL1_04598 [Pseudozyma flocculosa PF-1]SPO41017.1 related to DNA ligase I [Pseudozyma flocculosa]